MEAKQRSRRTFRAACVLMTCFGTVSGAIAQGNYADLSLDDLMNVEVIEAITKTPEVLFEAPLDVSVLQRDEIIQSGATSIPEALRLVPGMIVREQSPGNYDVHLRGFDNATVNSMLPLPSNAITLVMIDYRIVYNHFASGTFWDTLPVDINNVKRIEVIRGPSSALYGPNAVAGVINIVTTQPEAKGLQVNGASQVAGHDAYKASGTMSYKGPQASALFAVNYETRDRHTDTYYEWSSGRYVSHDDLHSVLTPDDLVADIDARYPNPDRSLKTLALNGLMAYQLGRDAHLELSAGWQDSEAQKVYVNNLITPLSTNGSTSSYADLKLTLNDATRAQLSILGGDQRVAGLEDWQYDLTILEGVVEHDLNVKRLKIRPGLSYRLAEYDGPFIGGSQSIVNAAASLLLDYKPAGHWRFLGALRGDRYEHTDNMYPSFQFAATYMPNVRNIFRGVAYYANKAPSMLETHIDHRMSLELAEIRYQGNPDLHALNMTTYEIGWRTTSLPLITLDVQGSVSQLEEFGDLLYKGTSTDDDVLVIEYEYFNHDLRATQYCGTVAIEADLFRGLNARFFATLQDTQYDDEPQLQSELDTSIQTTPTVYGGFDLNYRVSRRIDVNTNGTFSGEQEFSGLLGVATIPAGLNANAQVAFHVGGSLMPFLGVRNLFSDGEQQYGFADAIERTFVGGVRILQ